MGRRARGRRRPLTLRRAASAGFLCLVLAAPASFAADAPADARGGAAAVVEREFEAAIKTVTPATVYCVAPSRLGASGSGSSGVIVTRDGYVLSDSDAGAYLRPKLDEKGKPIPRSPPEKVFSDVVEVRIPDLKKGSYVVFTAKTVLRVPGVDSALLKIEKPPANGFPFVVPRTSADLDVGQFTFAVGTSFPSGEAGATSSLTAGIVSGLVPLPDGDGGGRWAEIYTSAAVNPGVNGGPLVDADAALVGVISTWAEPSPSDPFQFLGKAYPIDRIRAAYKHLLVYAKVFPDPKAVPVRAKETALLETAIGAIAKKAAPWVVSLTLTRSQPLRMKPVVPGARELARYNGPTSGIVVSRDGWIVASLYAFADIGPIADVPSSLRGDLTADLGKITDVSAQFADGTTAPARIVAHDERWGIVCLKATLPPGFDSTPPEPAPKDELRQGRLVVGVANPFGAKKPRSPPFVTLGMLSRVHPEDSPKPWAGQFQTDANMTDGTVGGALVDVQGRLLGMATLWNPAMQGRNSGIGFGVPWERIEAALPALRAGTSFRFSTGYMGVGSADGVRDTGGAPIGSVELESPAEKAGIKVGDRITSIEGKPVDDFGDLQPVLRTKKPGERVKITVNRDGKVLELEVVLGERPPPRDPATPPTPPTTPPAMGG